MSTITIQLTPADEEALAEVLDHMNRIAASDETAGTPFSREEIAQTALHAWLHEQRQQLPRPRDSSSVTAPGPVTPRQRKASTHDYSEEARQADLDQRARAVYGR